MLTVEAEQPDADTSGCTRLDKQVPHDSRVGVELHLEQTVRAGVTRRDNFADEDYLVAGFDLASFGFDQLVVGAPRTYGLTVGFKL